MLILATLLLFELVFLPKTDCQDCSFKINNTDYDISEFVEIYHKECIEKIPVIDLNITGGAGK